METAFEKATKYYPNYWNIQRLKVLVLKEKLTKEEFFAITNIEYDIVV